MSQVGIQQAIECAMQHRQAGRTDEAEAIFKRFQNEMCDDPVALHSLGVGAQKVGLTEVSLQLLGRAIAIKPDMAEAYNAMGIAFRSAGKNADSLHAFKLATEKQSNNLEYLFNLAAAQRMLGHSAEALQAVDRMIALSPAFSGGHFEKGRILEEFGEITKAIESYRVAVTLQPMLTMGWHHLAAALAKQRRFPEAVPSLKRAAELDPKDPRILTDLGFVFHEMKQLNAAAEAFTKAIKLQPDDSDLLARMGNVMYDMDQFQEAATYTQRAVSLKPDSIFALSSLTPALLALGQVDDVISVTRKLTQADPKDPIHHDSLLNCMRLSDKVSIDELFDEHRRWEERFAAPLAGLIPNHRNNRQPDRPLRIGYVSPDLHCHPVSAFLMPILAFRDQQQFHVTCYKNIFFEDTMTSKVRAAVQSCHTTYDWTDERLANQIIEDRIDILVDLAQHTVGNRMRLFARKPAPVQITYLGYPGTTGLKTFDAQLSDPYIDPPGQTEQYSTEPIVRLPHNYWCFTPIHDAPPVGAVPAQSSGSITFGAVNKLEKASPSAIKTWAAILNHVPKSRLIMIAPLGAHRQRVLDIFIGEGVDPSRVELIAKLPIREYFSLYQRIDIALDSFPYNGGTTTCQALWMGVPVITLAGVAGVQRSGVSILKNMGLPELIATNRAQYVQIATDLAGDIPRLSDLRQGMRQRMLASPLTDAPRFVRELEAIYRNLWRGWCSRH